MRRFSRSRALGLGVVALACSGQQAAPNAHGIPTPLAMQSPSAEAPAVADASARGFELQEFAPLLALPALAKARAALEAGRPASAGLHVKAAMAVTPPPSDDVKRWQYLLGRLLEEGGDLLGAAASYELASKESWPLSGYASLGAGRVLSRAGKPAAALEHLRRVPTDLASEAERRALIADAAYAASDRVTAIDAWRAEVVAEPDALEIALRLSKALLEVDAGANAEEALRLARRVRLSTPSDGVLRTHALATERRAIASLGFERRRILEPVAPDEELFRVRALERGGLDDAAEEAADALLSSLPEGVRWSLVGCEAALLRAKAISAKRERGRAADSLADAAIHCKSDEDQRAAILYNAAKFAAQDGRHAAAAMRYRALEKELPHHRLADDARVHAALAYFEMGAEERFTELLATLPEDHPGGDVVLDGVFRLAMRRVEKGDWSGAASVLDRAAVLVGPGDAARGTEHSGRERYFRARGWMETGEVARGLDELEAIVREMPLSYYMLHAYSRLAEVDAARAARARDEAMAAAANQPFRFEHHADFLAPGFVRALELLRQGDIARGKREIHAVGISGRAPSVLWGVALLYAKAGSARLSHGVARGLLKDWLERWPAGDWSRAWEIAFPRPHHAAVERESKKHQVPEALIYGVMREESAFDEDAHSPADAFGLMQLIVPTAKLYARPLGLPYDARSLTNPRINIALGAAALANLTDKFAYNPLLAIPAYNAGPGRPARWLRDRPQVDFDVWVETIPITETRRYVKRVLASRAAYAVLYDPSRAEQFMTLPKRLVGR